MRGAGDDDGRLELDDAGRVLDHDALGPAPEIIADRLPPSATGRLASSAARLARRRPALLRSVAGGAALVALLTTVVAGRDTAPPVSSDARVMGAALVTEPDVADAASVLVATYRVTAADPRTTVTVDGVVGPGIRASSARGPAGPGSGDRIVAAIPDCADPLSLDVLAARYALETTRTGADGASVSERIPAPDGIVDWASAVRRACWTAAGHGLTSVSLAARVAADRNEVTLDVGLRNGLARDVEVHAVDIADVATLDAPDGGVVRAGATRILRFRLPVTDCTAAGRRSGSLGTVPGGPASLPWALGPAGHAPVAVVGVPLRPAQVATVARAVRAACGGGPSLTVRVLDARPAPRGPDASDTVGAAVLLRLGLATDATQVVLGQDTTGLTADARVAFPGVRVTLRDGRAAVTLTWNAPCAPAGTLLPHLPVLLGVDGRRYARAVPLSGGRLAEARARACSVARPELQALGSG